MVQAAVMVDGLRVPPAERFSDVLIRILPTAAPPPPPLAL
jgi:hypothetical protein